jgi:hypothetical protein
VSTNRADPSPYRLRALLGLGGVVAISAGLHTLVAGGKSFPPWRHASAMVESELRWYSAYYVASGFFVLRTATLARPDPRAVHAIAAAVFLGALGRAGAWATVGRPHPFQRALLAVELALPPIFVIEQRRLGMQAAGTEP